MYIKNKLMLTVFIIRESRKKLTKIMGLFSQLKN